MTTHQAKHNKVFWILGRKRGRAAPNYARCFQARKCGSRTCGARSKPGNGAGRLDPLDPSYGMREPNFVRDIQAWECGSRTSCATSKLGNAEADFLRDIQ